MNKNLAFFVSWVAMITLLDLAALAETAKATHNIKPIESLWYLSIPRVTSDGDAIRAKEFKEWQKAKVFDAFMLQKFPPTLSDEKDFNARANALIKEVGGRFIIATVTVGKEGWETSSNQRMAQKFATQGGHNDASKTMTQLQWLETFKGLESDTWAWVLEQPARMPTPEQAAQSASEFVRFTKAQHKRAVIWLSAEAFGQASLNKGMIEKFLMLEQRICEATRADADYFAWMDLPGASLQAGESQWRETMGHLLDKILTLTPKEKTVIQWSHSPRWPAKDVAGTEAYISTCQAKGINRFCVLAPWSGLDREPWSQFYRTLPKTGAAAAKMGVAKVQDNNQPTSADREAQMEQRMNDMIDQLGLTTDAKAKFKTTLQEQIAKMREIFQQSNGDREKARAEIAKLREATVKKLKDQGILNDEQLAKY